MEQIRPNPEKCHVGLLAVPCFPARKNVRHETDTCQPLFTGERRSASLTVVVTVCVYTCVCFVRNYLRRLEF